MIRSELMRHVLVCLVALGLVGSTGAQDDPIAPAGQPSSVTDAVQEVQAEVSTVVNGTASAAELTAEPIVIPEDIKMDPVAAEPVAVEGALTEDVPAVIETVVESSETPSEPADPTPVAVEAPVAPTSEASAPDIVGAATQLRSGASEAEVISVMSSQEETKRKAYKTHLRQTLVSADAALKASRYEDAIGFYEESRKLIRSIGNRPEDRAEKDAAEAGLAESYYRQALYLKKRGSYEEASKLARLATGMGHPQAPKLAGELRDIIEKPPLPKEEKANPRWKEPEYQKQVQQVGDLLRMGRQHMVSGEWENARAMFETVLAQDPENTEAIRMLEKIGNQRFDASTAELEATKANMMADVRGAFNPRDYGTKAEDRDLWQEWEKKQKQQPIIESDRIKILTKMKGIKIPEIDFRQANINDVITFLQQQSVECDEVSKGEEQRGVNIILNLSAGAPSRPAEAAPADPFASATGAATQAGGEDIPPITFSARYITLHEALRIVTEVAGLKFTVSGSVVMVMHRDAPEREMLTRMYDVLPSVGDRIDIVAPAVSRSSNRGSGDFIAMDASSAAPAKGDWKEFFSNMGVGWPAGSSVKHIPEIGKIIVKNTPDNLTTFESVLSVLNVVPYQIEIEARFVEVGQDDLNSLGFEWNLTDNWEIATKKSSSGDYLGNQQKVQVNTGSFTTGMRFADDINASGDVTVSQDNLLTVASVLTNPELELVLHALQQKTNTDLLSAPKVTTQSGLEATLKVVTEYIYPTSFTLENNDVGNNGDNTVIQNSIPVAVPENFETREVGVILSVLPEVSPEGQMINLTMSPEVVSEPEWYNYGAVYTDANGNEAQVNMPQPFFHTRSIQTSISVYNGATVVMGGLIAEVRASTEDKIPFLGDIPLIGRLFQSKYDKSIKKNLLVFVTARLVDPAGRPVKRADTLGIPDSSEGAAASTASADNSNR